jgi:hypothetical protein
VRLVAGDRALAISDLLAANGEHDLELLFHLGPEVRARLEDGQAHLTWTGPRAEQQATLTLPAGLSWTAHRGESDPPRGWYSPSFGTKQPTTTLVGAGRLCGRRVLETDLVFHDIVLGLPGDEVHQ